MVQLSNYKYHILFSCIQVQYIGGLQQQNESILLEFLFPNYILSKEEPRQYLLLSEWVVRQEFLGHKFPLTNQIDVVILPKTVQGEVILAIGDLTYFPIHSLAHYDMENL